MAGGLRGVHHSQNYSIQMFLFIPGWDYQFIIFIEYLTKFMILENIEFKIYVIEQSWTAKFNRARLISIGYEEAMKDFSWDCLIFHDVDRIPQKSKIDYNLGWQRRRRSLRWISIVGTPFFRRSMRRVRHQRVRRKIISK